MIIDKYSTHACSVLLLYTLYDIAVKDRYILLVEPTLYILTPTSHTFQIFEISDAVLKALYSWRAVIDSSKIERSIKYVYQSI